MIELFEQNVKTVDRQSSKGNQLKWENDGAWYKADYTGYEGLSEYVISHLLIKSSLRSEEYVVYDLEEIKYKTVVYNGVRSDNFLKEGWQLITIERLFYNFFGKSLQQSLYKIDNHKERLEFLTEQVIRITGLQNFGNYINKLFTIDAFFLNEDRHTHNIAVLMNEVGAFDYCPIFDNGAGLLADTTMDYPLSEDIRILRNQVKAKTVCMDLDEQLELSEQLYGEQLKFYFTKRDVYELLRCVDAYGEAERKRVEELIYIQMDKYKYLFES